MMLSFIISPPVWMASSTRPNVTVPERVSSYNHKISATVGFDNASISFICPIEEWELWLDVLGDDFVASGGGLSQAWNGFVNRIEVQMSGQRLIHGPMLDIANKVRVVYRTIRYPTNPPTGGQQATTDYADDTISQDRYSVLYKDISGGETEKAQAESLRDTYLLEYAKPQTSHSLSLGGSGSQIVVKLSLLGYYHLLKYPYSDSGTADIDASDKITNVIAAGSIIDTSMSIINDNTVQVNQHEDGSRTAETIIKEIVSLGGTSNERFLFGVYDNRAAIYGAVPVEEEYSYNLSNNVQNITSGPRVVDYWDVRPGKWLSISNIIRSGGASVEKVPSVMFIESVSFTMPNTLSLSGGKVDTVSQKLARLGLGDI